MNNLALCVLFIHLSLSLVSLFHLSCFIHLLFTCRFKSSNGEPGNLQFKFHIESQVNLIGESASIVQTFAGLQGT